MDPTEHQYGHNLRQAHGSLEEYVIGDSDCRDCGCPPVVACHASFPRSHPRIGRKVPCRVGTGHFPAMVLNDGLG